MLIGAPLVLVSVFFIVGMLLVLFRRVQALDYDLRAGLENEEFELHYQPIVRLDSGKCVGCEALIRWRHPEEGVILPGLFVPSAEKTGLINPIGEWVVRHALDELEHAVEGLGLEYVSINVSPIQLNSGSFDRTVRWLAEAAIPTDRLVFEVTEKAVIRESQTNALDTLERARRLGCKLALDDFGTGYSSLSNLTRFEFGVLKVERQFVQGINQSIRTNSVLESIVRLGHELGVRIIAEGVETEEQRSYLEGLGVKYAQGWLYSAALPRDEFERYLSAHSD
jgi:EAL domain-containing protein (putative c-di-GMP-specific phosphodiesterase class I)